MRRIVWDENKDSMNRRKHRVSFPEASQVFFDPLLVTVVDHRTRWTRCGSSAWERLDPNACLRLRIPRRMN